MELKYNFTQKKVELKHKRKHQSIFQLTLVLFINKQEERVLIIVLINSINNQVSSSYQAKYEFKITACCIDLLCSSCCTVIQIHINLQPRFVRLFSHECALMLSYLITRTNQPRSYAYCSSLTQVL